MKGIFPRGVFRKFKGLFEQSVLEVCAMKFHWNTDNLYKI